MFKIVFVFRTLSWPDCQRMYEWLHYIIPIGGHDGGLCNMLCLFQTYDARYVFSRESNCTWQARFISCALCRYSPSSSFFSSSMDVLTRVKRSSRSCYI